MSHDPQVEKYLCTIQYHTQLGSVGCALPTQVSMLLSDTCIQVSNLHQWEKTASHNIITLCDSSHLVTVSDDDSSHFKVSDLTIIFVLCDNSERLSKVNGDYNSWFDVVYVRSGVNLFSMWQYSKCQSLLRCTGQPCNYLGFSSTWSREKHQGIIYDAYFPLTLWNHMTPRQIIFTLNFKIVELSSLWWWTKKWFSDDPIALKSKKESPFKHVNLKI